MYWAAHGAAHHFVGDEMKKRSPESVWDPAPPRTPDQEEEKGAFLNEIGI